MDSGIVRRMDDLGRVVIPKEIRKIMGLSEGTPLEISWDKEQLIVRKYSPIYTLDKRSEQIAKNLSLITGKTAVITDMDKVIYSSSGKFKEIVGKNISKKLINTINERKSVVVNKSDGGTVVPISDEVINIEKEIIVPVIANGDCFGCVMLVETEDKSDKFTVNDVNLVRLSSSFLSLLFE